MLDAARSSLQSWPLWHVLGPQKHTALCCQPHPYLQGIAELQQHFEAVHWITALCCCCEAYQFWLPVLVVVLLSNLHPCSDATQQSSKLSLEASGLGVRQQQPIAEAGPGLALSAKVVHHSLCSQEPQAAAGRAGGTTAAACCHVICALQALVGFLAHALKSRWHCQRVVAHTLLCCSLQVVPHIPAQLPRACCSSGLLPVLAMWSTPAPALGLCSAQCKAEKSCQVTGSSMIHPSQLLQDVQPCSVPCNSSPPTSSINRPSPLKWTVGCLTSRPTFFQYPPVAYAIKKDSTTASMNDTALKSAAGEQMLLWCLLHKGS